MLSIFANKHVSDPHNTELVQLVEDTPESWADLLNNPRVIADDDESKDAAPVLCGAKYFEDATDRDKENIEAVYCLVLDVDCPDTPTGKVPGPDVLKTALGGIHAVIYTSPSHKEGTPRLRLLLPLETPLPPKKHRALVQWLSQNLVPGYEGCINVESTGDPGRLGFVMVTKHPEDYRWFVSEGALFDWTSIPLEDEAWNKAPLSGLERNPLWSDEASARQAAKRFFARHGQGVGPGGGRSKLIWAVSNQLWYEWAAENEEFVFEVIQQTVNENFTEPEDASEIQRQIAESYKITIGEKRKGQLTGNYGWRRDPTSVITREAVLAHAARLLHRRNPEDQSKGLALKRLVNKTAQTLSDDVQARKGLLTKLIHELAKVFQFESVERVADFFTASVGAMQAAVPTFPGMDEVKSWIASALERQRKNREENLERADAKMRDQIDYVTGGERNTKYTLNEVSMWEQSIGLRHNNWILVVKRAFFVFCNGTWVGPYTKEEFDAQGYKDLAAAADVGVRTQAFSEQKGTWTNVPLQKLLHDYGSCCTTRMDLNCDKTWFDVDEHVLVLAGPPKRDLTPKFHEEVDEWLRRMTRRSTPVNVKVRQDEAATSIVSDDYNTLCDWIACVAVNDRPCAALFLEGPHSVGKGLFAEGVARIWKHGAISLEDAFDDFNNMLAQTPLIWIDEQLPEHVRTSVLLRKALAAREIALKEKYMNTSKVTGCLRMVFTSNNLDLFNKSKELVKKQDIDALALRFVHINVDAEASAYLESLHPRHEDFVEKDLLAEHALWLHDKRWAAIRARGFRFLVKGQNTNVSDVVATNSDSTSECCRAICEAIVEKQKANWLIVRDSEVLVNTNLLKQHLTLPMQMGYHAFNEVEVTRAIKSIAEGSKTVRTGKSTMRMRSVRTQALQAWCVNKDVYEWSAVDAGITAMSKATLAREENDEVALVNPNENASEKTIVN